MILTGKRILVVEDDALIRLLLVTQLGKAGCIISASASRLADATHQATNAGFDVCLLDLNLAGQMSFPVCDILVARRLPFVFSTAYEAESIPAKYHGAPLLTKPYTERELVAQLCLALGDACD